MLSQKKTLNNFNNDDLRYRLMLKEELKLKKK